MEQQDNLALDDVKFDELESVNQYETTFTGHIDDEEITLTYTLENAIGTEEEATVYVPGDDDLEQIIVQPETYEFETDDQETVHFAATDDEDRDLFLIYVFSEAEDADLNAVDLNIDSA